MPNYTNNDVLTIAGQRYTNQDDQERDGVQLANLLSSCRGIDNPVSLLVNTKLNGTVRSNNSIWKRIK